MLDLAGTLDLLRWWAVSHGMKLPAERALHRMGLAPPCSVLVPGHYTGSVEAVAAGQLAALTMDPLQADGTSRLVLGVDIVPSLTQGRKRELRRARLL